MANALKDLSYYTTMAGDTGAVHAIADSVRSTFDDAVEQGGAQKMLPELVTLLTERKVPPAR